MSRFDDRLTRGFDEIAERVTPSSSALSDFRAQVAQHTPHEEVVIMLSPDSIQPRRPRWVPLTVVGATAALALALAGIILLRSDTDDTLPSATTAPTPTTADRELVTVVDGWQRIDDAPSLDRQSVEALPGGGFLAASSLMWSPDGLNWFDGDPHGRAPRSRAAAVVGDQVVILVDDDAPTLWIGDPTTGSWEPMMNLDTSGLERELAPFGIVMVSGNDRLLVAATTAADVPSTPGDRLEVSAVVWLVDPVQRETTRTIITVETLTNEVGPPFVWFDGRWHLMLPSTWEFGTPTETVLWTSSDAMTWTEDGLPEGMKTSSDWAWFTAGSSGVVICATHEGNEGAWFSPNAVDWEFLGPDVFCRGVYSDSLGFVLEKNVLEANGPGFYRLSPDGTTLEDLASPFPGDTMAASGGNLIVDAFRGSEYSESESAGVKGLWLYHEAGGTVETPTITATDEAWPSVGFDGDWVEVAVGEPWVSSVAQIEALPAGGYVAALERVGSKSAVVWSPDGVEWFDGDPDRQIDASVLPVRSQLAVTSEQVIVVDGADFTSSVQLAVGDPRTGVWDRIALDYTALEGQDGDISQVHLAANDDHVLVAAYSGRDEGAGMMDVVVWVVDPTTGTSKTSSFSIAATVGGPPEYSGSYAPLLAWVDGRWLLFAYEDVLGSEGPASRNVLWTSRDGMAWSPTDLPTGLGGVASVSAGPNGAAVATCVSARGSYGSDGDYIWYSADGLEWTKVDEPWGHVELAIAVGDYGFVTSGGGFSLLAADGSGIQSVAAPFDFGYGAASSSGDTLLVSSSFGEGTDGLWLYSAE